MSFSKNKVIGGNAKLVRSINRSTLLNLIRTRQPVSRAEIARITNLNKSTVSSIVNDLIEENLIDEQEIKDQNVGRNPILLSLKPNTHFVGAINIDSSISRVAIVDIDGRIVKRKSFASGNNGSADKLLETAGKMLKKLQRETKVAQLQGIGVSVAGIVDRAAEVVRVGPNLKWHDVEIGRIFRAIFPEQDSFSFENDAKASALAELWFGSGRITDINDFVFLSVGIGIGAGIVVGKKLLDGFNHSAGEFGHTIVSDNGPLCNCGNRGCLEVYASDRATVRRYLANNPNSKDISTNILLKDIIQLAKKNNPFAIEALKETGHYLGIGISTIVKSVDPQAVVIGGKIIQAWDIIYPEIKKSEEEHDMFHLKRPVEILPSALIERPRLIGAATLIIRDLFSDYQIVR